MKSKEKTMLVERACYYVLAGTMTAAAAALRYGVNKSSISRALKRLENKCPHCGKPGSDKR